ncbi:MAG: HD domain-containing protein [Bdellovibrionaceae bacterium]|nr:HD domain-containing protein [Pseudobdellovibrionaceae bacterium]MBX3034204.1 HD domain-containing protein [Pseudobdellovibrionaceae bacterium]
MISAASPIENLIAIPSFELRPESALPFDLFVRLPVTNRVILYRREGSTLDQEKFDKVSSRQLNFFVPKDHYERYLEYVTRQFLDLLSKKPADSRKMQEAAGRMLSNAFSQENVTDARELLHSMGDFVTHFVSDIASEGFVNRQTLFLKFAKLAQTGTDFQRHPLHVASLTIMLVVGLGIQDQRTLVEVGLAGLMHDVGLTQLPVSVITEAHKYRELGTVSRALLKLHPQGSLDLLRSRGINVSKLMESMILQHHEEFSGNGYPTALIGEAVHPLAQVLHVADDLDELLAEASDGPQHIEARLRLLFERYERETTLDPALRKRLHALLF